MILDIFSELQKPDGMPEPQLYAEAVEQAKEAAQGVERDIGSDLMLRVEGYYKWFGDLLVVRLVVGLLFVSVLVIAVIWMFTDRALLVPLEKWTVQRWGMVWRPS